VILPSGPVRVLIATKPVDFRKGMNGLAAIVWRGWIGLASTPGGCASRRRFNSLRRDDSENRKGRLKRREL
jgi:hypothetical protein